MGARALAEAAPGPAEASRARAGQVDGDRGDGTGVHAGRGLHGLHHLDVEGVVGGEDSSSQTAAHEEKQRKK